MTHTLRPLAMALTLCSTFPACVINGDDDDDDGAGSSESGATASTTNPSTTASSDPSESNSDPTASSTITTETVTETITDTNSESESESVDETQGESGVDVDPQDGEWLYEETGQTTNECTFIRDPSNGFGTYLVANTGAGAFTITPGDGTDPFTCSHGGGNFSCDERLSGTYDIGMGVGDANGSILVAIEGTLDSADHMTAEQQGRIECDGADCGTAEEYLGVTFPCEFTIPFTGTAQ